MTPGGADDLHVLAQGASARADAHLMALKSALADAARASARAEVHDARAECERLVAERMAALSVEVATARAGINVDLLRAGAVAELQDEVAALRAEIVVLNTELVAERKASSDAVARCGELEHALQRRAEGPQQSPTTAFTQRLLRAWQRSLVFCDVKELAALASVCPSLRVQTQNEGLWELACRRRFPPASLVHCTSFRAALVSQAYISQASRCRRTADAAAAITEAMLQAVQSHEEARAQVSTLRAQVLTLCTQVGTLRARLPLSVRWQVFGKAGRVKGRSVVSDVFDLGPFRGSRILFYPAGDETAMPGYCSLFLKLNKGSDVSVDIYLNGRRVQTLERRVGRNAKQTMWGYSDLAPTPRQSTIDITVEIPTVSETEAVVPEGCDDVVLPTGYL